MGLLLRRYCGLMVLLVPGVLAGSERPREVPFKLYRGYTIVVRGEIGELRNLHLLVDTGALPSVIDRRIARKLGLSGPTERLSVSGQIVAVERVVLPEVRLGPIRAKSASVLVSDLSFIEEGLRVRIDGMVGLDILGKQSFSIDYGAKKLRFGPVNISEPGVVFEAGLPYVVVVLREQDSAIRLLVDTGTNHLILFDQKVRPRLRRFRTRGTRSLSNISGSITLQQVELADPRLGDLRLPGRLALVLDTPSAGIRNFDGLLGVTALGVKRVGFDFERRVFSWAR